MGLVYVGSGWGVREGGKEWWAGTRAVEGGGKRGAVGGSCAEQKGFKFMHNGPSGPGGGNPACVVRKKRGTGGWG